MYVQCLGDRKKFLIAILLSKAIILCKKSFIEGLYKVVVVLGDTPYYHTPFYIGLEIL